MRSTNVIASMARVTPYRPFLVVFLLGLMVPGLLQGRLDAASGGKTEVLPVQKAAPQAVAIDTPGSEAELRRQMRTKNGVAELHTGMVRFSQAPTGSFGFITPQFLGMALVTQSPDLMLERASSMANAYEVHKLADGGALLVGFTGQEVIPQITPSDRPKTLRISLYSNPSDKAPLIVAVPLIKLMVDRMPRRLDPNTPDGPVMLDMDLQGTANRKTPVGP
jgi:hypothetical protein